LGFLPLADAKKERACVATPLTERSHGFCRSSLQGRRKIIKMWGTNLQFQYELWNMISMFSPLNFSFRQQDSPLIVWF
jgi:hypothetical protein